MRPAGQKCAEAPVDTAQDSASSVIDTAFYVLDPAELDDPARHVPYPLATLKTLSPQQWALMELRQGADLPILQKCYSAFPPLSPDWLDFRNELHMTNDKDLFIEHAAPGLLPLFEGKMIWQYSHKLEQPQYWLEPAAFDGRLRSKELHRMAQDLGLKKADAEQHASAIRFDREFVRLGFRDIARDTDERTIIFSLLPKNVGAGNKVPVLIPKVYKRNDQETVGINVISDLRKIFALAIFNSLVFDWLARFMIQISVNLTYLYRLPTPQPASDVDILQSPNYRTLARNALRLTLHAGYSDFAADLAGAMQALGVTAADVPATAKEADRLRAENDQIVAQLYGLTAAEFARLLASFQGMARKRPEYLTLLQEQWRDTLPLAAQ